MKTNLDHLSAEEISGIKKRYYQGESVYQMMAEYGLHVAPSMFYKLLPPDEVQKYGCSLCGVNLVADALPRSKTGHPSDPNLYYCPVCHRKPFADNSGYISFPQLSDEQVTRKRKRIKMFYARQARAVKYEDIPLTMKIYLEVLCTVCLYQDQFSIHPLAGSKKVLASTPELQRNIYSRLLRSGIIIIDPESPLEAFDLEDKRFPRKYDYEKVSYILNLTDPFTRRERLDALIGQSDFIAQNKSELLALWEEIAVGECVSYLLYRLNKIGFSFRPGEKTEMMFRELLKNFSVSQIYYIIWSRVNDASRWYLEGGVTKQRAASSVIGACQRYGEKAALFERELPQYRRPSACSRSMLTDFFYNTVLNLGSSAEDFSPGLFWE